MKLHMNSENSLFPSQRSSDTVGLEGCGCQAGRMTRDPLFPVSSQIGKHAPFTEEIATRWLVAGLGLITVMKEELCTVISLAQMRSWNEGSNLKHKAQRRPENNRK